MPPGGRVSDFEARLHRPKRNRACDSCRERKSRCDGYETLDNICTSCITYGVECTYFQLSKKPSSKTYVRQLENKLAQAERLVRELSDPNSRASQSVRESQQAKEKQRALVDPARSLGQAHPSLPFARIPQVDAFGALPETNERDNEDLVVLYDNREGGIYSDEGGAPKPLGERSVFAFSRTFGKDFPTRRPDFWVTPACLLPILNGPRIYLEFPEPSLMRHLLDIYFDIHNTILPVLHRPSFERSFADKLHERNESFGTVVILTCAIACRYSDDPRVKHSVDTPTSNTGWNLFNQIDRLRRTRLVGHQLYDVQIYALAACFLDGFAPPHIPWKMAGIGLRVMLDVGVHMRKFTAKKSLENELWKRSFWVLVVIDRPFSGTLGRPCAVQQDDFDVDLPLSCDDEYLEHHDPEKAFKQPAGVPSQMDYFISMIRLIQILDFALRTLYSTRKSRPVLGYVGKRWESHILSSLETAMEKWADSVPPHLRWDALKDQTNMTWLRQALALACNYHELQIVVRRQFIGRPDPTLSGTALTVCNEAAINCAGALGSVKGRVKKSIRCYVYTKPLFVSAIFLALGFYREKNLDRESERYKAVETVREMLVENGPTWSIAVPLTDFLDAILIASDSQYEGWKPEKEDLIEFQMRLHCSVDRYGNRSVGGPQSPEKDEEKESDSQGSTSLETTPSPLSIPLVERSIFVPTRSPSGDEGIPIRISKRTTTVNEITQVTPSRPEPVPKIVEPLEPAAPTTFGVGGGLMDSGIHLPETATEPPGPSFTAPQLATTLPASGPGFEPELGYGQLPPSASSSVLPAELMVYNDLIMDIGTAQYLGTGVQDLGSPQFTYPTISANVDGGDFGSSSNWYQWEGVPQPVIDEPPSMMPSTFGYHQPGPQYYGVNQSFVEQMGAGFEGKRSPRGVVDYKEWGRTLCENFMMGQQTSAEF